VAKRYVVSQKRWEKDPYWALIGSRKALLHDTNIICWRSISRVRSALSSKSWAFRLIQCTVCYHRRRASNVEPSSSTSSLIVGADDLASGFCVSVGRHSRGFSLSLRPQRQQQQQLQQRASPVSTERPLLSVVIPDPASLRQRLPGNADDQQPVSGTGESPGRYTIYQPLLATGRAAASQPFYELPRRRSLLTTSLSGLFICLSVRHGCTVAKRCKIGPRLPLITNRKSHTGFQMTYKSMTLDDLEAS